MRTGQGWLEYGREKLDCGPMPFLAISTNAEVSKEKGRELVREASKAVSEGTGKPEQYVMVKFSGGEMIFGGSDEPAAFLEVKSIGYPGKGVKDLAMSLTSLITSHLGVPGNRVYIAFEDVKGAMWAFDSKTFG